MIAMDLTIIIPTFNRLWALPKAINSCRDTKCKTEIVVIDDGSTDGTWQWLSAQQNLISLRTSNWGKPWAVNRAFEIASGRYIRFLDSDDWVLPRANDIQLQLADDCRSDLVVGVYE